MTWEKREREKKVIHTSSIWYIIQTIMDAQTNTYHFCSWMFSLPLAEGSLEYWANMWLRTAVCSITYTTYTYYWTNWYTWTCIQVYVQCGYIHVQQSVLLHIPLLLNKPIHIMNIIHIPSLSEKKWMSSVADTATECVHYAELLWQPLEKTRQIFYKNSDNSTA